MANVLIRDLPDHVVGALDAKAKKLGLSRNEYLRRQLTAAAHSGPRPKVTVADLQRSATVLADLDDPDVMAGAWG